MFGSYGFSQFGSSLIISADITTSVAYFIALSRYSSLWPDICQIPQPKNQEDKVAHIDLVLKILDYSLVLRYKQ